MTSITTNKEEYLNILNELLELPSMPDIGEPDVILADGGKYKNLTLSSSEKYLQELHNTSVSTNN